MMPTTNSRTNKTLTMKRIETIKLDNVLPRVFAGSEHDSPVRDSQVWLHSLTLRRDAGAYLVEAESGTGKSSLCSFIYGNRRDYSGHIYFDDRDLASLCVGEWCDIRRRHIALLPQEMRLFPELTAMENIQIKNRLTDACSEAEIRQRLEALEIEHKADTPAALLSIGQQQRVAIVRALCQPFDFLILDEPVSHLDRRNNLIVAAIIAQAARAFRHRYSPRHQHHKAMSNNVWKLLRRNISVSQIVGYAIANLVGLSIIIAAVQFYGDTSEAISGEDSFLSKDYVIISKKVSALNTMGAGGDTSFSPDEIKDIERQSWTRRVGQFTGADFSVMAAIEMGGRRMSTYLFFEAIPDQFLDINPRDWSFDPANPVIPVIMSKDYLTLYNFGFATTRNMPQLSEGLIGTVPMTMTLSGNGLHETLPARIVGFSSRLNTIAVPQSFLDWANERYAAPGDRRNPSRLIIEANTAGDPAIAKYIKRHGYEIAGDKADNSKAAYFLRVVTTIVLTVGIIISLLAFFILMLSIYLLLQKNKQKLHDLMLLGYSPGQVARPYYLLIGAVNAGVLVLSLTAALTAASWWSPRLADIGMASSGPWAAICAGVVIVALLTCANALAIRRIVHRNFYAS